MIVALVSVAVIVFVQFIAVLDILVVLECLYASWQSASQVTDQPSKKATSQQTTGQGAKELNQNVQVRVCALFVQVCLRWA